MRRRRNGEPHRGMSLSESLQTKGKKSFKTCSEESKRILKRRARKKVRAYAKKELEDGA